ncbi:MAG: hypothetical protein II045_05115, partial [Oscillospiraceae bacterium]|nr:hypothetical protein [Oscillospiraceae bacterium]
GEGQGKLARQPKLYPFLRLSGGLKTGKRKGYLRQFSQLFNLTLVRRSKISRTNWRDNLNDIHSFGYRED